MKISKKITWFLFLVSILSTNAFAIVEGKDYTVLKTPIQNAQNTVYEVWAYSCSHCFIHHKLQTLKHIQNELKTTHVGFIATNVMGKYGNELVNILAYATHLDNQSNTKPTDENSMYHKVSDAYFRSFFAKKQSPITSSDKFYQIGLDIMGIKMTTLDEFLQTKQAKQILSLNKEVAQIAILFGTPTFIVNGKYKVEMTNVKDMQSLINLIKEISLL